MAGGRQGKRAETEGHNHGSMQAGDRVKVRLDLAWAFETTQNPSVSHLQKGHTS